MKHWISKAALAAAMVASSGAALAADGQFFVNGEVGSQTRHLSRNATGVKNGWGGALRLGYLWNVQNVSFGLEAGYINLGKMKFSTSDTIPGSGLRPKETTVKYTGKQTISGAMFGANLKYHFGENWFASARGGLFRANNKINLDTITETPAVIETLKERLKIKNANKFYAGLGVGYDFNEHFGLSGNFDYFGTGTGNAKLYGVSAEYRF